MDAGGGAEKWVDAGCPVGESLTSYKEEEEQEQKQDNDEELVQRNGWMPSGESLTSYISFLQPKLFLFKLTSWPPR